jgi:hypothetical protein
MNALIKEYRNLSDGDDEEDPGAAIDRAMDSIDNER